MRHSWTIEAILKGDYMVYLVAIPEPGRGVDQPPDRELGAAPDGGSLPAAQPRGVLPVVIAVPLGVTLILLVLVRLRLRRLARDAPDEGGDGRAA